MTTGALDATSAPAPAPASADAPLADIEARFESLKTIGKGSFGDVKKG